MVSRYLLLWFEAPLQSWGFDSKFGRRDTQSFPTKSGVMGLICAALGAGGEARELLSEFSTLGQTVVSYTRVKERNGVLNKLDREPFLCDFHMVGSGYDDGDPWKSLLIPKTADGKKAVGGGTKMTSRYYLQDAAFSVVMEVPSHKAEEIVNSLKNPVWDIYLGRKCCIPTDFVYRGIFTNEPEALSAGESIAQQKNRVEDFRVLHGVPDNSEFDEVLTLNDVPVQFGPDKQYRDRQVSILYAG